jgi:hypothetical protein
MHKMHKSTASLPKSKVKKKNWSNNSDMTEKDVVKVSEEYKMCFLAQNVFFLGGVKLRNVFFSTRIRFLFNSVNFEKISWN